MAVLQSLLWLFLFQPMPAGASQVTASALVVQGRQAEARRKAIDKALRNAVLEQAMRLPGLRGARRRLFAEFKSYVRSYRILEERFVGSGSFGRYRVTLQITLDRAALAKLSDRLSGRKPVEPRCVSLTWNETPGEKAAGAQAMVHLKADGFNPACKNARRPTPVRLSCRIEAQGRVETKYGATVECSLTSNRAAASTSASALASTPQKASLTAHRLAAAKAAGLFARRLEDAMACRRLRRIIVTGPVEPAGLLRVAHGILGILSQKDHAALLIHPGRVTLSLVTNRCNLHLIGKVSRVATPPGLRMTASSKGRDLFLLVAADDSANPQTNRPESSADPASHRRGQ